MKYIYFGTSPRTIVSSKRDVLRIYDLIKKFGYGHTSDFVTNVNPEQFYMLSTKEFNVHHKKTLKDIGRADVCVFEASIHSLSVGYLASYALDIGKSVVVLSKDRDLPLLFRLVESEDLFFVYYDAKTLEKELKRALEAAVGRVDVRFNFFISAEMAAYLDKVAKKRRVPRSVFIRELIEAEMKRDRER